MKIFVYRYSHGKDDTISRVFIDDAFECYALEDEYREVKVPGETRIPAGTYQMGFRTVGGHHERYLKKYPDMHRGMLEVKDVPNFKYILIHQGNHEDHTAGCLLVGTEQGKLNGKRAVLNSAIAYKKLYPKVADALERGEEVSITYKDIQHDKPAA